MTTINQKNIIPGTLLTAALVTLHTAPALTSERICNASVTNDTAGVVALTLHVIPAGGAASSANKRVSALPIAIGETYIISGILNRVLEPGDFIQAMGLNLSLDVSAFTRS